MTEITTQIEVGLHGIMLGIKSPVTTPNIINPDEPPLTPEHEARREARRKQLEEYLTAKIRLAIHAALQEAEREVSFLVGAAPDKTLSINGALTDQGVKNVFDSARNEISKKPKKQ